MARCIAEPLSRKDIRKTAELIRKIDGSENDMFFDIVRFLEIKLPSIDSNFNFRVLHRTKGRMSWYNISR